MPSVAQTVTMAASPAPLNFSTLGNSEMCLNLSGSAATEWVLDAADAAAATSAITAGTYAKTYAAASQLTVWANPTRLWAKSTSSGNLCSAVRVGG